MRTRPARHVAILLSAALTLSAPAAMASDSPFVNPQKPAGDQYSAHPNAHCAATHTKKKKKKHRSKKRHSSHRGAHKSAATAARHHKKHSRKHGSKGHHGQGHGGTQGCGHAAVKGTKTVKAHRGHRHGHKGHRAAFAGMAGGLGLPVILALVLLMGGTLAAAVRRTVRRIRLLRGDR